MTDKRVLVPGPDHPITIEATGARVRVKLGNRVIADTQHAITLQEGTYPAVQYIPIADVDPAVLVPSEHTTHCPYKGDASYYGLRLGDDVAHDALWFYEAPHDAVAAIRGHAAFYPGRVDAIEVDRAA